jgi:hypothetical protein
LRECAPQRLKQDSPAFAGLLRNVEHRRLDRLMQQMIKTFLMFDGKAEEAMNFYVSQFSDAAVTHISRYGAGELGAGGVRRS